LGQIEVLVNDWKNAKVNIAMKDPLDKQKILVLFSIGFLKASQKLQICMKNGKIEVIKFGLFSRPFKNSC
jgi:hypothetical protein